MNELHRELLQELKQKKRTDLDQEQQHRYHGTSRLMLGVRVPEKRKIAKKFLKQHSELEHGELSSLMTSLYSGKTYDERTLAGHLLEYLPHFRTQLSLKQLESWIGKLEGWAEVDSTCQSLFSGDEVLERWSEFEKLIKRLGDSKNINQRRASVVLMVKAVSQVKDRRLEKLAFRQVELLKSETDILITKAISWILRSMVPIYARSVAEYVEANIDNLPKIAVRETRNKIITGTKHGRQPAS